MHPPKLWHYYLPNINHQGWAEIVIGSNGFFAAVSDYGNYSYAWRSMGVPARQFFLRAREDWLYFATKLAHDGELRQYDGEATRLAVREAILVARRSEQVSREQARDEWQHDVSEDEHAFSIWYAQTCLPEAHELRRTRIDHHLKVFCQVIMGRLADAILAELDAEAARVEASSV